jgi:hypothetical protein
MSGSENKSTLPGTVIMGISLPTFDWFIDKIALWKSAPQSINEMYHTRPENIHIGCIK